MTNPSFFMFKKKCWSLTPHSSNLLSIHFTDGLTEEHIGQLLSQDNCNMDCGWDRTCNCMIRVWNTNHLAMLLHCILQPRLICDRLILHVRFRCHMLPATCSKIAILRERDNVCEWSNGLRSIFIYILKIYVCRAISHIESSCSFDILFKKLNVEIKIEDIGKSFLKLQRFHGFLTALQMHSKNSVSAVLYLYLSQYLSCSYKWEPQFNFF